MTRTQGTLRQATSLFSRIAVHEIRKRTLLQFSIVAALLAGAASFLSPCVLPLLPGYVSLMSGYDMQELAEGNVSMKRVVGRTALFVLGFTTVFVALGATATSLSGFLSQSIFTVIAGWTIVVMGLFIAITAVWTPSWLMPVMKDRRVESSRAKRLGLAGPPVMGAAFAFGWTPCIGPFLASALLLGANSDTVFEGMLVLFFYSLGLGIPFLLTSLLLAKAFSSFNWIKKYLIQITVASGLMLTLFGVLLLTGRITELSAVFSRLLIWLNLDEFAAS
ncbi:MAG: cytochrome c biogenesis protein CcdA [Actinomycetia bacterium]|nr:cytochrome c biogenesis protein CcdA [Actinomycetes bacterium]